MILQREIWTYLLATLVTVLIWVWAAGETREPRSINALLQFTSPEPANWVIRPEQQSVKIELEGSKVALQKAQVLMRKPLPISVPAGVGRQTVELTERIRRLDDIRATGVTVLAVEPQTAEIDLDQIERFVVPVRVNLPGISFEGDVTIDPQEITIAMPGQLRQRAGQGFGVEAVMERSELDRLQPGVQQTQEVKLRLPEGFTNASDVTMTPSRVKLTFTIRSRTREVKLDSVRVQLAGPPEDREAFVVEIDPKQLHNVIVTADADLIRRIESNEVPVVAVLHVSSREKEAKIESKKITYFMALVPEPGGGTRGTLVTGRVNDSAEMPTIKLKIDNRP